MRSVIITLQLLLFASVFLAGCEKEKPKVVAVAPAPKAVPAPPPASVKVEPPKPELTLPAIDLSTPENTLKSYWAIQDAMWAVRAKKCEDCLALRDHQKGVTTGDLLESYQYPVQSVVSLDRTIKETKKSKKAKDVVEVTAVIKNVTPYPPEASPESYVKKKRESGDRYRYSLKNVDGGWKIFEISMWYEPTRTWLKITSAKPFVPIQTYP
jgi:hypothetical protein